MILTDEVLFALVSAVDYDIAKEMFGDNNLEWREETRAAFETILEEV